MNSFRFYVKTALFVLLTAGLAPFYILILLTLFKWRQDIGPKLVQFYSRICLVIFRVRIDRSQKSISLAKGQRFVIVSNHSSFLDIFILSALFGSVFVSKSEVKYYPVIGQIAWLMGVIFFDRGSAKERLRVLKSICRSRNRIISVFAQGTTGRIVDRLPFQRGIFKIIELETENLFLPVSLHYRDDPNVAWHGEPLAKNARRVFARKEVHVKVSIHDPVTIEHYAGRSPAQVCKIVEEMVFSELEKEY